MFQDPKWLQFTLFFACLKRYPEENVVKLQVDVNKIVSNSSIAS